MFCIYHLILANLLPHTHVQDCQQTSSSSLGILSFEISVCLACIPSSSTLRNGPKPSPLQGETVGLLKTLGTVPNLSYCTMGRIDTLGTACIPLYQWRKPMDRDHPNSSPFVLLSLLSIPSHCTITANGQTRIIPRHPIGYTLSLLSIVLSPS